MKRRSVIFSLPLVGWAQASPVAEIGQRLQVAALVRGRFEQDKQLAGFAKPLKSRGDYLLLRGRGLLWRTLAPFASQLALTGDRIAAENFRIEASQEPSVRVVTGLMLALLDGNLNALEAQFELQASLQGKQGWRASLKPRGAALAKLFQRIELEGDRQLRRIQLIEAHGDQTLIRFDEQQQQPLAPSAEELRALG